MQSEQEWQFIKNEIQNKSRNRFDEWFIGLEKKFNNKEMDLDQW